MKDKLTAIASALTLSFTLAACGETKVSPDHAFCEIQPDAQYPVRIVEASDNSIIRQGGYGRFDIDEKAETCAYTDKSGETAVYHIKPATPGNGM